MRRVSALLVAFGAACASLLAQVPDYRSVIVERTDGSQFSVTLTSSVAIGFEGEEVNVSDSKNGLSIKLPKTELAGFRLSTSEAAIDSPSKEEMGITLTQEGVEISGAPNGTSVELYNSAGTLLWKGTVKGNVTLVPLKRMAQGINLVKAGGRTFKVVLP